MLDCVMLDIGGTYVKYGAVQEGEKRFDGQFPIQENGSREEVLYPILDFLTSHSAAWISICFPDPADYASGTFWMRHKFQSLYGVSLKQEIQRVLPGTGITFLHDGAAYAIGEMMDGALRGVSRGACVLLGTGLGFVLCEREKVLLNEMGMPLHSLWNQPYREGIAEDYVSGHGIRKRYVEQTGQSLSVKEITDQARQGNEVAQSIMKEAGKMLGELLTGRLRDESVECVTVGGQIAKSLDLLLPGIRQCYDGHIIAAKHLEDAALRGAYYFARNGEVAILTAL